MIMFIFGGFLWLRLRARAVHAERRQAMSVAGIFLVLPMLLIAESRLFERLPYGPATNTLLKALILASTFAAIGFGFLRPARPEPPEAGPSEGEPPGGSA